MELKSVQSKLMEEVESARAEKAVLTKKQVSRRVDSKCMRSLEVFSISECPFSETDLTCSRASIVFAISSLLKHRPRIFKNRSDWLNFYRDWIVESFNRPRSWGRNWLRVPRKSLLSKENWQLWNSEVENWPRSWFLLTTSRPWVWEMGKPFESRRSNCWPFRLDSSLTLTPSDFLRFAGTQSFSNSSRRSQDRTR